jgi:hypothetical protein
MIRDADGEIHSAGIARLKHDLTSLGYSPKYRDLKKTLEQITSEKPGVTIEVSYGQRLGWWIDGPCDNEVIDEYREKYL